MVMKASLQLKMGAQLTMTPQLQQAIRLLQLSTLDLQQEIQQALDSNPMLEATEDAEEITEDEHNSNEQSAEPTRDNSQDNSGEEAPAEPESWENENWQDNSEIPDNLPVDTAWDDVYQSAPALAAPRPEDDGDSDFESRNSAGETLQDHLLWQLNLTPMSERDRAIAHTLIDAVDDTGYLTQSIEELLPGLMNPRTRIPSKPPRWRPSCTGSSISTRRAWPPATCRSA